MILYIIGLFLLIPSIYYAIVNTRYLFTGKGKPRLYPTAFLLIAGYGLVFNMLWNHSCEIMVVDSYPLPQTVAYPVVDTTLTIIAILILWFNTLSVLSIWSRDHLSILLLNNTGEENADGEPED